MPLLNTPLQDVSLPADATDTITSLRWSPVSDHLAAASWDGKVRIYDVANDGRAQSVASIVADGPVFSCDWNKDGSLIAATGADKKIRILQASTSQTITFTAHTSPVRALRFVDIPSVPAPILASGSWDSTVRYWDLRQTATPLEVIKLPERVYSMDTMGSLLVIATADRGIHLVDLHANPAAIVQTRVSQLNHQTKVVVADPDGRHWATGSIEGRAAVAAVDPKEAGKFNFSWRCHRSLPNKKKVVDVYAVNDMSYHPAKSGIVATAGSDGTYHFWDLVGHRGVGHSANLGSPVTACAYNRRDDGTLFAYALGYDWSFGYAHRSAQDSPKLMLHRVTKDECATRSSK